jgi:predicted membrane-bound dolichyl-phosphate-mannose-protein mannosyltransferase
MRVLEFMWYARLLANVLKVVLASEKRPRDIVYVDCRWEAIAVVRAIDSLIAYIGLTSVDRSVEVSWRISWERIVVLYCISFTLSNKCVFIFYTPLISGVDISLVMFADGMFKIAVLTHDTEGSDRSSFT